MKNYFAVFSLIFLFAQCATRPAAAYEKAYKPDDIALYNAILAQDSIFFDAYNNCTDKLDKYAAFYAENIEFYHDKGGLATSKAEIVASTQRNICGKVRRERIEGSIEVYPIKDFGAIEMGLHRFWNNEEHAKKPSRVGRFMIVWKKEGNEWRITKVVSLH